MKDELSEFDYKKEYGGLKTFICGECIPACFCFTLDKPARCVENDIDAPYWKEFDTNLFLKVIKKNG